MPIRSVACCLVAFFCVLSACTSKKPAAPGIQILTYSSLGSSGGFLDSVKDDFKQKTGCELRVESTLGAAQVLSYLEEEKQRKRIDWVMGIDELLYQRASRYLDHSKAPFQPDYLDLIAPHQASGFYPVDYGALSFIYRKADFKGKVLPHTLTDLKKPEFRKKFIVQDPRASSPGMIFFLFADSIVSIHDLRHQWLTLAPSWSASYQMFLAKDAPMVWSYLTSLAYHASKHDREDYDYVQFKEGLPLQVEGMALVNHVGDPFRDNPCNAAWLKYVLSAPVQATLVSKQWMMPVLKQVTLPKVFEAVPEVKKGAVLPLSVEKVDALISRFGREVQGDSL